MLAPFSHGLVFNTLGIPSAHVLRKDLYYDENHPMVGNLMFHHLYGSKLFYCTKPEYQAKGQNKLLEEAKESLLQTGACKKPFIVPMGGSSFQGLFGYIEFIRELENQLKEDPSIHFDEILFSCGSGGTASGLVVGRLFCENEMIKKAKLIGYTACDTPQLFHDHVNEMLDLLEIPTRSEECITFTQSKGIGYAVNDERQIEVIAQIARSSGIILDTAYSGKAMAEYVREGRPEGVSSLFIHTGGLFSIFAKPELFNEAIKKMNS